MSEQVNLLTAGIGRAFDLPDAPTVRNAYLQPMLGWNLETGLWGQLDLVVRPRHDLGIYAYGRLTQHDGPEMGLGARWEFW